MATVDAPQVDVVSRPGGDRLIAPDTNPALQLASSLQGVNEGLTPVLGELGSQLKAKQEAKAYADALSASGKGFADAVRSGKIQPTQNPWYIQAYERNAAQVRGQAAVSSLVADSQSWAEKNDPKAFAEKFNASLGKLGDQFQGIDQAQGFQKAAVPLADATLSQNVNYNVDRIQKEHVQDATSLSTQAVMDTLKADPKATPEQIFQSMEDQHKSWIAIGGDEAQWRLVVRQAVIGAGANLGNADLLDVLKAPYLGGQPIANQADETGKPVGLLLDADKITIDRGVDASLNADWKARQAAIAGEGSKVDEWANQKYGNDYAFGKVPLSQLQADGVAAGFSGQAIVWAADHAGEALRGAAGYSQAQTAVYSQDPEVQQKIIQWNTEAITHGLTPHLINGLNDAVARQWLTVEQANAMLDRAQGQSHFAIGEANANRREAASLARADAGLKLQSWSLVGDEAKHVQGVAGQALSTAGFDVARMPAKTAKSLEDAITNAALAAGDNGPGAAGAAASDAATRWVTGYVNAHKRMPKGPAVNPNR